MGEQWSGLYGKKNIYSKQLENMRANSIRKLQTSKYRTFKTTEDA